jgi:hypothetical protein
VSAEGRSQAERELHRRAAVRDLVAGAALLGVGWLVGGSSFDGSADGLDYAFDGLAALWIGWALLRLARPPKAAPTAGTSA